MKHKTGFLLFIATSLLILFVSGLFTLGFLSSHPAKEPFKQYRFVQQAKENAQSATTSKEKMPVNLLLLGLDEEEIRTDVIMLLNFSPSQAKLNVLSISRDTKVRVNNRTSKINALFARGGEEAVAAEVEELTGLPVHYFLTLNFKGFKKIIDSLGGVEFKVPFDMDYDDPDQNLHIHLKKGEQVLDGEKAEQLVRYRKGNRKGEGYIDGDIGRVKMQQEFIRELIRQKVKMKYLTKADDLYFILKKYLQTNFELQDINYYLDDVLRVQVSQVNSYTLPGDSDYIGKIWYFIYDPKKTSEMIQNNFFM